MHTSEDVPIFFNIRDNVVRDMNACDLFIKLILLFVIIKFCGWDSPVIKLGGLGIVTVEFGG